MRWSGMFPGLGDGLGLGHHGLGAAHHAGSGNVVLVVVIAAGLYAAWWPLSRVLWPFTACPWCKGRGRNPGSNSRRHGRCWRCKGRGERMRFGARAVARLRNREPK